MDLYSDRHPNTSLKNTGFKNSARALNTLRLIRHRSLKYQSDVINTMYNRAKHHPNQTPQMLDAMKIFKVWLKKYKNNDKILYPFLSLDTIKKYLSVAKSYDIDTSFYKLCKTLDSKYYKLQYIKCKQNLNYDYWSYRIKIINKYKNTKYYSSNGNLTKSHIILIMYAFSPFEH
jgi:hypothetical protein